MKTNTRSSHWLLIAAFAAVGAVATLPLAIDSLRANPKQTIGKVTLTCFDQNMQPNDCTVAAPTLAAK